MHDPVPLSPVDRACPRCGASSAPALAHGGVCLRCAGERVFADGDFALPPPVEHADDAPGAPRTHLGPYEIIEEIGRGGMGRVYAACQAGLGRIVALKVLPESLGGAAGLELRFLREVQTAARLRHPHIINVHDFGRADGHVYFSMDYVEGGDLARRLREQSFTPRAAATLLHKVAGALAYTHGEGVLHRDLKPSNILLDGEEPRLADFGLAAQLAPGGDLTSVTGVLGTPHYVAPEVLRAGSGDFTAASDLYALGVLCYEMLAGRPPFAGAPPLELATLVATHEPPPLRLLAPGVPPDLETICFQCLEREPARRYASAAALAEDLRRFLAGEPILARPPGALARLARFTRRHRTAFIGAASVFAVLVAATILSTSLAVRATLAEKQAAREAAVARAISDFLQNDLLAQASPFARPDRDVPLRTVLDEAAKKIAGRFDHEPLVEAGIRETLGNTFNSLGEYAAARPQFVRALSLRQREQGASDRAVLHTANQLATTDYNLANYAPASALARATIARQVSLLGPDHPETLQSRTTLAAILEWQGQLAESEEIFRDTLARQQRILPAGHLDLLETMGGLSSTLLDAGKFAEAERLLRTMHAATLRVQGPDHPYSLLALNNLAGALWSQGKFAEAAEIHRANLAQTRRVFGEDHPDCLRVATSLARCLAAEGRNAEAVVIHRETLARRRRLLGDDYHDTLRSLTYLANVERELGELGAAEQHFAEAFARERRVLGEDHPDTWQCADDYAAVLLSADKAGEAAAILRSSVAAHARLAPDDWRLPFARCQLAAALIRLKQFPEAESLLLPALADLEKTRAALPPNVRPLADAHRRRTIELYTAWEKPAAAAEWQARLAVAPSGP